MEAPLKVEAAKDGSPRIPSQHANSSIYCASALAPSGRQEAAGSYNEAFYVVGRGIFGERGGHCLAVLGVVLVPQ
jgi:hypothetical protein